MLWCYCAFVIRYPLDCNLWNASLFPPALVHSRACPLPSQCLTAVLGREDPALMPILAFLFDSQTILRNFCVVKCKDTIREGQRIFVVNEHARYRTHSARTSRLLRF